MLVYAYGIYLFLLDGDDFYLHCMDTDSDFETDRAMKSLTKELKYWENDLKNLQQIYKNNNYDKLNYNEMTQDQLAEKAMLEDSIKDGKININTTLKEINDTWGEMGKKSSSLGKRNSESSQSQSNKKQS